ncbi:MAG: translation initiation factor IF-2 [Holosporales bacterium]|jgi:translation initiation factor IF-2|nr:translation initiation factor IF-2 [Holosporales bacterium]
MADNDEIGGTQKRKTLSLKSGVGVTAPKFSSGNRTIEVEIRRRKSGLTVDVEGSREEGFDNRNGAHVSTGKLTDSEFKTRVKALQEALKDEEFSSENDNFEAEENVEENLEDNASSYILPEPEKQAVATEKKKETGARKPKRAEPKKKEQIDLKFEPVVFRASEYQKKQELKTPQGAGYQKSKITTTPYSPQINNVRSQYGKQDKDFDELDSHKKKMKLVVKSKDSDKRIRDGKKVSRVFLERVMNSDSEDRFRSMASIKRARQKLKGFGNQQEAAKVVRDVDIPDIISVGELANRMAVRSGEVVKYLLSIGTVATVNQLIDGDTAEIVCSEFGHIPKRVSESDIENELTIEDAPDAILTPRPPIVAVMGHVDHGKTTLLDSIRKTSVAQKEAGGITQHVAAYQIETKNGKKITFIDTPGHAAFSNIRARGAVITDIIILVVAADDGIKDQTIEVINQAKSQKVPLIVAINKIDKPNINIDRVKTELMSQEIILEDFGGEVLSVAISAKNGTNLDGLLDAILLQSEMLELKANNDRKGVGVVLESRVDKGRGIVASVIVQNGAIRNGDFFVAGSSYGKVRTIYNDKGKCIKTAPPSAPVEIVGFNSTPEPGDVLAIVDSEQKAREIAEYRENIAKTKSAKTVAKSMEQMLAGENSSVQTLNVLIKADVYGSLEAVAASLEAILHPDVNVKAVEKGIGIISESDIDFAKNTNAIVIGFNVNASASAKDLAKTDGVSIMYHNVIYHIVEEIKAIMGKMLAPIVEENYIGRADVRKVFFISRLGTIAGCYVSDGIMKRNDSKIKVIRNGECVFEGKVRSMKHEKDEIKESPQSHECGILADGFNDFKEGDQIECYEIVLKSRSVD